MLGKSIPFEYRWQRLEPVCHYIDAGSQICSLKQKMTIYKADGVRVDAHIILKICYGRSYRMAAGGDFYILKIATMLAYIMKGMIAVLLARKFLVRIGLGFFSKN